eukprot:CAMPEP_0117691266 /NCGR_PEP_ID=MMETSP0804-20121206/25612_1 /TAXON_ID=1074897 /ORGANISM="Tetraselmis astigmatica, Strain CCMP880" /LENGTH=1327 /DNA_ID=CAMNT_0005504455 /DNA_START=298 /DNA_END=4282 /DNA_ORIENTATION=+
MSGLSSLSNAPGMSRRAQSSSGVMETGSSLGPLPDASSGLRRSGGADPLAHLDDLFEDLPKKTPDKSKKKPKPSSASGSKSKKPTGPLDDTDEDDFPTSRGKFQRPGGLLSKSKDLPLMPPSSDSEDSPGNSPSMSTLRARRGLGDVKLRPVWRGAAEPSRLDRLTSFLQEDIAEVRGDKRDPLDISSDLDVFGVSAKETGPARGRRSSNPGSDPVKSPDLSPAPREVMQSSLAKDDFLDLDGPPSPPAPGGGSTSKVDSQKLNQEKSDDWSLDLDILPEGGGGGGGGEGGGEGGGDNRKQTASAAVTSGSGGGGGGYTPSAVPRVGRRAQLSSPSPASSPSSQPASAAARSRLSEEAKRQMELDLESSGELDIPGIRSGPPPPISSTAASAAVAFTARAREAARGGGGGGGPVAGRRASVTPPSVSPPPLSPPGVREDSGPVSPGGEALSSNRPSGTEIAALKERHAKELEAVRVENKVAVEALQDEVRRLATKLADGGGGDQRKVAALEGQLRDLREKQDADREKHVEELSRLRGASADNIQNLEKIQALETDKAAMQRSLDSKDQQLRQLDNLQAELREKDYKLFEANKQLDAAKASASASLTSATAASQAEIQQLRREAEEQKLQHAAALAELREEAAKESARKVGDTEREVGRLKADLEAAEYRIKAETAAAEARGRRDAEEERDKAVRELKAREAALEEEREVVQRHAVSAQVLSDLSRKVDTVAAQAVEREERIAVQIDRNLRERESVMASREADFALREESLSAREKEAEMLRRQLQTVLAALEKTAVQEKEDIMAEKQRLQREQSRLDVLTSSLQGERADLRMQVETEKDALSSAREARLSDREALVNELCEERRRVAEERVAAAKAADLARVEEHAARRRCFEYEARANAALSVATENEERAEAAREALQAERRSLATGREALEKEKAAIHEEASQLTALGLQIQGRSAELRALQEEAEKQQRLAEESNNSMAAERASLKAREHSLAMERRKVTDMRKAMENERVRMATERKALSSDRVAASRATEAARDVQLKLGMMVRAWAAEGIAVPVDWEALNFAPSALSEDALQSIRMKVGSEWRLSEAKAKANHRPRKAGKARSHGAMSDTVRRQMEFLEQLRKQEATIQQQVAASYAPVPITGAQPFAYNPPPPATAAAAAASPTLTFRGGIAAAGEREYAGPPSPNLTQMLQISSSSASSMDRGRAASSRRQPPAPGGGGGGGGGGLAMALSPLDNSSSYGTASTPPSGSRRQSGGGTPSTGASDSGSGAQPQQRAQGGSSQVAAPASTTALPPPSMEAAGLADDSFTVLKDIEEDEEW